MAISLIRILVILLLNTLVCSFASAQKEKVPIAEGNKLYKQHDFERSAAAYNKALTLAPANPLANYNMGNTQFRLNKFDDAIQLYDSSIANSHKKPEREQAYYNKGVSYSKQKKLDESIDAYKDALKLNSKDQEARENLQKALLEKKKQDQQNSQNDQKKDQQKKDQNKQNPDKKQDKNNKDQQDKDKQDQQQQPKDQQSKLTKQQAEQLLKALEEKEKQVQKDVQKAKNNSPQQPDKDW